MNKIYSINGFQLKAEDVAFDALFDLLPINFCCLDAKGYILGCNQRLMDFTKTKNFNDIAGKHVTSSSNEIAWVNSQTVIATGKSMTFEEIHLNDKFEPTYFLSIKSPIICDEKVIGIVILSIDITDRKLVEMELEKAKLEAETANNTKTEFLVNLRHDLKTPLSGIMTIAEFLESSETEPSKVNYLRDIKHCATSLLSNFNEIIDHVKSESGEFAIIEREFDIHTILKDIYNMLLPMAVSKKLDFTFHLDHIPPIFIGDAVRTERILLNIISNSIKFTDKGHVRLFIMWCQVANNKGVLEFVIDDSGIGIPDDKQEIIFEKFHRLHPSYEGLYSGSGLGLNIVKRFIEELEGEYKLISVLGKGTVFKVRLPYKVPTIKMRYGESSSTTDIHFAVERLQKSEPVIMESKKKRILLVEDNLIISRVSKDMLETLDLEVDVAENGHKALELIGKSYYDMVLMDIGLPDISGYEVTKRIRLSQIGVPIIAITAHTEEEDRQKCIDAGMQEMITKPLTQAIAESIKAQLS